MSIQMKQTMKCVEDGGEENATITMSEELSLSVS
jgi:hypothetical protein